jgi:hypothetical protein
VWDGGAVASLTRIEPGGNGSISFSLASVNLTTSQGLVFRNPEITVDVSVKGRRVSGSNLPEEIFSTVTKKLRISSVLTLLGTLEYEKGPFENTGPVPPKAEEKTTYTIIWSLKNSTNDLADATVRATLPPYVEWVGVSIPQNEQIEYNPEVREITWKPGQIKAGAGYSVTAREVSFQVRIEPSISQVGAEIPIVGNARATAIDRFTETGITSSIDALVTKEKVTK